MSSTKSLRSIFRPSSNGRFTAASTHRMIFSGAAKPRNLFPSPFLNTPPAPLHLLGRAEAANLLGVGLAEGRDELRVAARGLDLVVLVAQLAQWALLGHDPLGQRDGRA